MLEDLFQKILNADAAAPIALDQKNRVPACFLGVVTRNDDPEKQRRILVSSPIIPGLDSYWVRRLQVMPFFDPPMPTIGQTVLLLSIAGDFINTFYLSVVNDTNAPIPGKKNVLDDSYQEIPGNGTTELRGNLEVMAGKSIKLVTASGSYVELNESGEVVIASASGHKMTLGGSNGAIALDAQGGTINGINAGDFKLSTSASGGKTVATVTAPDTRGDTLIGAGWK
jgi:hypothetical protein